MEEVDVAVIGAGNAGIAVAYYLVKEQGIKSVALVDARDPMSLTSAQSGENYRNWWPHPTMTAFTDHSTRLMEELDIASGGRLNMTRGGYALVTRRERPQDLIDDLYRGYAESSQQIRLHESRSTGYQPPVRAPWQAAPDGVDVLLDTALIRENFPHLATDVRSIIHIRSAGSISGQQMGQYMLEQFRAAGGQLVRAQLKGISGAKPFTLDLQTEGGGTATLRANRLVNAAGPFLRDIAQMLGEDLPVKCLYQQKIAFQDREGVIPRQMPFTIDLDGQTLAWSDEDRELLASDPAARKLVEPMPGGIHCRPDGAVDGNWIKMGWAYNATATDPHDDEPRDPQFPDSVLRAGSRLHTGLAAYIGRLPRGAHHYGGYYTMTEENWPLIGPMRTEGAFVAGALSGFGTMAACSTGSLCAALVAGGPLPQYAKTLGLARYEDEALMRQLKSMATGVL